MDEGKRIQIFFLQFEIGLYEEDCDSSACECDWLEIEGEQFCGEKQPFIMVTNTNTVDIRFISNDFDASNLGFMAIWSATTDPPTTGQPF